MFEITGWNPLLDVALELEKIVLEDEYSRKLSPNVDFYSGLIYQALGLRPGMFGSRARPAGSPSGSRGWPIPSRRSRGPRPVYTGPEERDHVTLEEHGLVRVA